MRGLADGTGEGEGAASPLLESCVSVNVMGNIRGGELMGLLRCAAGGSASV
jgi:hypothetical protein